MSQSTSKMLGKLTASSSKAKVAVDHEEVEQNEAYDTPRLSPSPKKEKNMQNVLADALNLSSTKNYSPMD